MATNSHRLTVWRCLFLLGIAIGTAFATPAFGQDTGSVAGTVVSSWDGSVLGGVTVTVRGTTLAMQTDPQGRFKLDGIPPGDQVLRLSKPSYAAAVVTDVRILPGQTTTVNGNLRPEFYEMEEYEVTAEEFKQQTEQMLIERQKSSVMMESLGSDFLSRVGAGNAAESISKVSGATIVDGKFAVIRGLNDRYVTTTLNGASIPSADPYRQSASLDLFPSQVIDRVVVAKTFTPDQPGTFTGGGINVVTKSFPEKPFVSLSLGTAYNPQANLNDGFLTYRGGGLDWAGMDDGTRALSGSLERQTIPTAPISTGPSTSINYSRNLNNALLLDQQTRELGTTEFAAKQEASPLNHNFSLAGGDSVHLFDQPFGYFAGLSYKHDYQSYGEGVSSRYQQGTQLKNSYRDARSLSIVNWAGMVNLAYKPFENHELGFTFFNNQNGTDEARVQDQGYERSDEEATFRKFDLYYTERNLTTYQMKGEDLFPTVADIKFNWLVALTGTSQDEPDARFFNDADRGSGYETGGNYIPIPSNPTRYFRNLAEDNRNTKLDWLVPFHNWTEEEGQLKFGLFDTYSKRSFVDQAFYYSGSSGYNSDPNHYLTEENLGIGSTRTNSRNGNITLNWDQYIQSFSSLYNGEQGIQAAYLMLELPLVQKFRLVGGGRYETTDMQVYSESYRASTVTGLSTNTTAINQGDLLPALGLIYAVNSNMNFRLNYSQTIARPSFRECAAYFGYDPVINDYVEGNPLLVMTSIQNYDLRWEWFPRPGELVSASLFYKDLKNAIERGDIKREGDVITFFNRDQATLYGLELEARKTLDFLGAPLSPFSLGGNLSLVQSEVKLRPDELNSLKEFFPNPSATRPLYDQSPYIVNADLNYANPRAGTSASLILNIAGPRIAITKLNAQDIYEQPAPTLDFIISQTIGKHATIRFSAKNLLDSTIERTYGLNSSLLYSSYTKGRTFGLSFTYDF